MKTIARNRTKKIAEIRAAVTGVRVYDLSAGGMVPTTVEAAFAALFDYDFARLVDNENGTYNVNVHSNYWYVLTTVAPQAVDQRIADMSKGFPAYEDFRKEYTAPEQSAAEVAPRTTVPAVTTRATARAIEIRRGLAPGTVTVTRTRVAIGTQIAEACAVLGIELGHGTAKGLPCYVVNGTEYTAGELAGLVLEGGFDAAYGRAETIVRQDSPLRPGAERSVLPVPAGKGRFYVVSTEGLRLTARHDLLGPYGSHDMAESMAARYRLEGIPCTVIESVTRPVPVGDADEPATHPDHGRVADVERAHSLALAWNLLVDTAALYGGTPEELGARAVSEPPAHLRTMTRVADGFEFTAVGWAAHRARETELAWDAAHAEKADREAHTAECFRMGWFVLCGLDAEGRGECLTEADADTPAEGDDVERVVSGLSRPERRALKGGVTRSAARAALKGLKARGLVNLPQAGRPTLTVLGAAVAAHLRTPVTV